MTFLFRWLNSTSLLYHGYLVVAGITYSQNHAVVLEISCAEPANMAFGTDIGAKSVNENVQAGSDSV